MAGSVADLCLLDVLEPDGVVVRAAAETSRPTLTAAARALRRFPPDFEDPEDPFGAVGRAGEPLLLAEVGDGWLESRVSDADHRELLRSLRLRSAVVAPLAAQGRVLGLLTLLSVGPSRGYDRDDLALAEALARMAALFVERTRMRAEVWEARRAEAEFMASMSHEFRTPLHIVGTFAELLLMGVPEPFPPAAREHAEHIRTATRHLEHLVQQVLAFSRLEAEREAVRRERVDLVALSREAAGLVAPLANQKRLGFEVDLPKGRVMAHTDPNKLRQILFNLLGNAVKFTAAGRVRLWMRELPGSVVFEVRDTGIGIAPENLERIFEPFWQVDRDPAAGTTGAGLGLSIVRRLVRLLEGELTVRTGRAEGSVFRVTLPLWRDGS